MDKYIVSNSSDIPYAEPVQTPEIYPRPDADRDPKCCGMDETKHGEGMGSDTGEME